MVADRSLRIAYPLSWRRLDTKASSEQTANTAAALGRQGHRVTLLAPTPVGGQAPSARAMADHFGLEPDFQVRPLASRWAGDSLVSGLGWLRQLFASGELADFDMLLCRLPAILALGPRAPLPFAFDHYRPWPDIYPLARPIIRRSGQAAQCIGFALHSALATEAYRRIGIADDRLIVAHNGSRAAALGGSLGNDPGKQAARQALGLDPLAKIALYAGRVNPQKGLDQILAMARLRPSVTFMLVGSEGDGPVKAEARTLANVVIIGWQTQATLPLYLAAADALLIPPSSEPLRRFRNCILPLKTFAYLAAGRPIIAPALPDTAELLKHRETALLVEADNPEAAARGLDTVLSDPALAARLGSNARALAEASSWDARGRRLGAFFTRRLTALGA